MPNIINSGRNKIAVKQGAGLPLNVTEFVFAFIDGLDPEDEVDLDEVMPDIGDIVHQQAVSAQGYVSLDKVVYSTILSPAVGNFTFNWVGIIDEDDTLIAVSYVPPQYKFATVGLTVGNTLTRNFLMQYNNAQEITGIEIAAEAWQVDFMGRLNSIDEHLRQDMTDMFGDGFFIGDGFKIITDGSSVSATAGVGYVGGLRVTLSANEVITTGVLPKDIYIDAAMNADASSSTVVYEFQTSTAGAPLSNFTDSLGRDHYLLKIASVTAGYAITDLRKKINGVTHSIMQAILDTFAPLASPALTGNPSAPTQATSDNSTKLANTAFARALILERLGKITSVFSGSSTSISLTAFGVGLYIAYSDFDESVLIDYNGLANTNAVVIGRRPYLTVFAIAGGNLSAMDKNLSDGSNHAARAITSVFKVG